MHWTSLLHCLYDISVLPGATLPLKVLIFGVPKCRPNVRVVINCPMSDPAGAGHGGLRVGPEGTLPPSGCSATGVGCLSGPHLPPPGKVTSWSSSLGSLLPNGHTHSFGRGLLGVQLIHTVLSLALDLPQAVKACGHWGHQALLRDNAVFPHLEEFLGEECAALIP